MKPPTVPAACQHATLLPGRLRPTVIDPSYQLVLNGETHLARACWDVATWAERVHGRAMAVAAAETPPAVTR